MPVAESVGSVPGGGFGYIAISAPITLSCRNEPKSWCVTVLAGGVKITISEFPNPRGASKGSIRPTLGTHDRHNTRTDCTRAYIGWRPFWD